MAPEPYGQWRGVPMDDDEADELLESAGWGVLSIARDDDEWDTHQETMENA